MSGQALSPAEAKALGEVRESWCAVEMKKEQTWCRKQRQHSDEILNSSVFDFKQPEGEPRCTFAVNAPTHRERKHFEQQYNHNQKTEYEQRFKFPVDSPTYRERKHFEHQFTSQINI